MRELIIYMIIVMYYSLCGYSHTIKHLTEGSGGACGSLRSGSYEGVLGKGTNQQAISTQGTQ
jgi:hypothetical protein